MTNRYNPDYAVNPGEYLKEIIESRDISLSELSKKTGLRKNSIKQMIEYKRPWTGIERKKISECLNIHQFLFEELINNYEIFHKRHEYVVE